MRREPYDADDIGFEVLCGAGEVFPFMKTYPSRDNKSGLEVINNKAAEGLAKRKTAQTAMPVRIFPYYHRGKRLNIINPASVYAGQIY